MKTLLFDLHVHSKNSKDSLSTISSIISAAKKKGLDGIAITDHNFLTISQEDTMGLLIIPGMEIETDKGDLIGIFIKNEIKSREFLSVVREIKKQDGIVILPHPYRGHEDIDELAKHVDCIEVYNPFLTQEKNELAKELARKLNKTGISSSDAHFTGDIGCGITKIFCKSFDDSSIKKALKNNKIAIITNGYLSYYKKGLSMFIGAIKKGDIKQMLHMIKKASSRLLGASR